MYSRATLMRSYMAYVRRYREFPRTGKGGKWNATTAQNLKDAGISLPEVSTLRRNGFSQKQARDRAVQILLGQ